MTQPKHLIQPPPQLSDTVVMHLPKDKDGKKTLLEEIDRYIKELMQTDNGASKIEVLELRKKLIDGHGLSVERVGNMESIFSHYCNQIIKTGKNMTFERLQYEKTHLSMDRFFVFLKDFGLTTSTIDGVTRQILDKNELVLLFKKASVNCKEVNFQQFMTCIEKIGLLFYDSKTNYNKRMQQLALQRQKRKENYIKSLNRRKAAMEAAKNRVSRVEKAIDTTDNDDKETVQEEEREPEEPIEDNHKQPNQNDQLIKQMMNDKNIQDPNEEMKAEMQIQIGQSEPITHFSQSEAEGSHVNEFNSKDYLLQLSPEEKIEYFYQLIDIDTTTAFKRRMKDLNMALLQGKHRRAVSQASKKPDQPQVESSRKDSKLLNSQEIEDERRLQQLRVKIQEKKEKQKKEMRDRSISNIPMHTAPKEEAQSHLQRKNRQRKQQKQKEKEETVHKKDGKKKKMQITDLSVDLSSLSQIPYDQINFHKFNPKKLYQSEESDPYLQEYFSTNNPDKNEKRILANLQENDKNSQAVLNKLKKRTQQMEVQQKNQEWKYTVGSDKPASGEYQTRKNRLVEKLLKLQKS